MKSKKAIIFNIMVVMMTLLVLVTATIRLGNKTDQPKSEVLGNRQIQLFSLYQRGEEVLFYVDQAAKYAALDAVTEVGQAGGFTGSATCGTYGGYPLFSKESQDSSIQECFPDYKAAIESSFKQKLRNYLSRYNKRFVNFPPLANLYNILIIEKGRQTEVIGFANKDIQLLMHCPNVLCARYNVTPSFRQLVDYDLSTFKEIKTKVVEVVDTCSKNPNYNACMQTKARIYTRDTDLDWSIGGCFSDEELACMAREASILDINPFGMPYLPNLNKDDTYKSCSVCARFFEFKCDEYTNEKYCLRDPCVASCAWDASKSACVKSTTIPPPRKMKFCVTPKDGTSIKFALYIPDLAPPALPTVMKTDNGDGTITLTWDASQEADFDHYDFYVYIGQKSLSGLITYPGQLETVQLVSGKSSYDIGAIKSYDSSGPNLIFNEQAIKVDKERSYTLKYFIIPVDKLGNADLSPLQQDPEVSEVLPE